MQDLTECLTYSPCSSMALRCRGSVKLMLGDLKVSPPFPDSCYATVIVLVPTVAHRRGKR